MVDKGIIAQEIVSLLEALSISDYKAIKYAEGLISEVDYAPIKAERQKLRDRINELEKELWYRLSTQKLTENVE